MPNANLFVGVWAIWGGVWLVAALRRSRTVAAQSTATRLLHLGLILVGGSLVFLHFNVPRILAFRVLPKSSVLAWGGLVLAIIGVGFAITARGYLGRLWSGTVTLKEDHVLVRSGPYAITRHPIYTGLLAALVGTAGANGTLAAVLGFGLVLLACLQKIHLEERLLRGHFGEEYADYCASVRALVPFLW